MIGSLAAILLAAGAAAAPAVQTVRFKTSDGWEISALYRAPASKKGRVALLVHGVGAGKGEWDPLAQQLWKDGVGTLAIDLRGHGESLAGPPGSGDWKTFDGSGEWPRCENDLQAALKFLRARGIPTSRVGAVGGSIGANLVSRLAAGHKAMPFAALLSPGLDYRGVAPARLQGRRVLVAASPADSYAFDTAHELAERDGSKFMQAMQGHGAQMLREPVFLSALADWIERSP